MRKNNHWSQKQVDAVASKKGGTPTDPASTPKRKPPKKVGIPPIPYDAAAIHYVIGIDPGKNTGMGVFCRGTRKLIDVRCMDMWLAQKFVLTMVNRYGADHLYVRFEDARLRKYFADADEREARSGSGVREGVGSVKRDCAQWQSFLQEERIPNEPVAPARNKTKTTAEYFRKATGWEGSTNEHSRDGSMLAYQFTPPAFREPNAGTT